jgi:hypothetical protein
MEEVYYCLGSVALFRLTVEQRGFFEDSSGHNADNQLMTIGFCCNSERWRKSIIAWAQWHCSG